MIFKPVLLSQTKFTNQQNINTDIVRTHIECVYQNSYNQ